MAWNPSPKVAAARDAANKFKFPKSILILVNEKTNRFEAASYGATKKQCDECKELADYIMDAIEEYYSSGAGSDTNLWRYLE